MVAFRNGDIVWYRNRRYVVFGCTPMSREPERLILRHPHRPVYVAAAPEEVFAENPEGVIRRTIGRWLSAIWEPPLVDSFRRQAKRLL